MRFKLRFLAMTVALLPGGAAGQVQMTLLRDIRPGAPGSAPWRVAAIGDTVVFMADETGDQGPELWATDGAGAWLVLAPPDSTIGQPRALGRLGDELYLMVGGVIWRTDGVEADTVRVGETSLRRFSACGAGFPAAVLPTRIVFSAGDGCAMWAVNQDSSWAVMDPFAPGTAGPGLTRFALARGSNAYVFRAFDGVAGRRVYRTNGIPGDFDPVLDPEPDVSPRSWETVTQYNGSFYYESDRGTTGDELWRWDAAGTPTLVEDIAPGTTSSTPRGAFVALGRLYFLATNPATGRELRMYDGSALTTPFEIAAGAGPAPNVSQVGHKEVGGSLYFWVRTGTDGSDRFALHTWDGTTLRAVATGLSTNDFHEAGHIVAAGGRVWFDGCDMAGAHGASLWQTDGTTASVAVAGSAEVCTGARPFMAMAESDGALLARVQDPTVGVEPFLVRPIGTVGTEPGGPASAPVVGVEPNPVVDYGAVIITLPVDSALRVEVFDLLGRRAAVLHDGALPAGRHVVSIDARGLAPGPYVVRTVSDAFVATARFVRRP